MIDLSKQLVAGALLALTVASAAGCGGKSSDQSSKAEFLRRADAICAQGNRQVGAVGARLFNTGHPTSRRQQLKFVRTVVLPSIERQVERIKQLTPPKGDEAKVGAITDAADRGIRQLKRHPQALLRQGQGPSPPLRKANKLSVGYGLKVCGG